jgi:protein-tyrosine phosphatase
MRALRRPIRDRTTDMTPANAPRSPGRLRIVFVCTGNRFRSPLAAAYLRRLLAGSGFEISSCGTSGTARARRGVLPEAQEVAATSAIDLSSHRTRWIGEADLDDADLVLGFERSHVAAAVLEAGAPRSKTFLVTELVQLLAYNGFSAAEDPATSVRELVAAADEARAGVGQATTEVPDPYGRSRKIYEHTALEVWRLAVELVSLLFRTPPLPSSALPRPRLERRLPRPRMRRRRA